jgi:hypothetical protein
LLLLSLLRRDGEEGGDDMFAKKREVCFHERGGSGKEGEFGCQLGLELGGRRESGRRTFEPVVLVLSRHGG